MLTFGSLAVTICSMKELIDLVQDYAQEVADGKYQYGSEEEIYDVMFISDINKELRGVRLMVAGGGPNIYINTFYNEVEGYWGGDSITNAIPHEEAEAITESYEELFKC